ncbi:diguanylate cyclase domain-containing protein [Micromonosporaceae bacterium Da 78-11]
MPENADADGYLQALRSLHAVSTRVHASLDLTETLDAVAEGVVEVAGFGLAVVNLAEPNGDFTVVSAAGSDQLRAEMVGTRGGAAHWHELLRRAERWGALYFVDHHSGVPDSLYQWIPDIEVPADPNGWHPLDSLFAPLMAPSGEWVGVLSVDLPVSGMRPGPLQCEVLALFAEHAAIAILHARMHSELEHSQTFLAYAATHDQLTGLANRTFLWARLAELADQPSQPIGVLIVDLDGFKEVNDGAGHDAGDEVLRAVARRMRRQVSDGDLLARLGGDEFVAVLTGGSVAAALPHTAERLRAAIARPIPGRAGPMHVTASIGYALGTTADDFSVLMRAADAAMYQEKRTGRSVDVRLA